MKGMRAWVALLLAAGLLAWPEIALNAAREAMAAWAAGVAPALFPFMALTPMLTSPEAARVYERLLGRWMRPLLRLPGSAAPAMVVAMTAGSPAGALAMARSAEGGALNRGQLERLTVCLCGLSPAFLLTGVGAAMLGSAADGAILLRSQIAAQLLMLAFTRFLRVDGRPVEAPPPASAGDPVRLAVGGVLSVCGYMVIFSVAAAILARLTRSPAVGTALLCLLDLPSGARALSALGMPREWKLTLIAACCGLGGACIAVQNLSVCRRMGVRVSRYALARAAQAALMIALTAAQLRMPAVETTTLPKNLPVCALIACSLAAPVLIYLIKIVFLNKRNSGKSARIPS